tara:strand:+ start:378 stop:554 length:177 start_codon:yes stop_codon:yes gene_type:complete
MNTLSEIERLQKAVEVANAAGDAYRKSWADPNDNDADAAWENAYFKSINESKKGHDDD